MTPKASLAHAPIPPAPKPRPHGESRAMATPSFRLKSLNLLKEDEAASIASIFHVAGAVRTVVAISAYVDIATIDAIVDFVRDSRDNRGKPTLKIYTDYSASNYTTLPERNAELQRCTARIAKFCSAASGIYLVRTGSLFHTKLYLIRSNREQKLILGSMNATENGLNKNEELVLVGESGLGSHSQIGQLATWVLDQYLPRLEEVSDRIAKDDEIYHFPTSMRQLLMDGWLYYERREQDPFRFSLRLPEELLDLDSSIHPLLPARLVDGISVMTLMEAPVSSGGLGAKLPAKGSRRQSWKRFCVETCYGHWSPNVFDEDLTDVLEERAKARRPYFETARTILKRKKNELRSLFESFCKDLKRQIDENYPELSWQAFEDGILSKAWVDWYDRLLAKLDNPEQFDRIVSGLTWTAVPDVWNDPVAKDELEASFFDSLKYYWSKSYAKRTSCLPAARIAANLHADRDTTHNQLKKKIETWAKNNRNRSIFSEE